MDDEEMQGMSFGHAGTIVEGAEDSATEKIARLEAAGIPVVERIDEIPERGQGEAGGRGLMAEPRSSQGIFIDVEVSTSDRRRRRAGGEARGGLPGRHLRRAGEDGSVEIVRENLDECVLCNLCVEAAPPGGVVVKKLYDGTELRALGLTSAEDARPRPTAERAALQPLRGITGETGGADGAPRASGLPDRGPARRRRATATVDREVLLIAGLLHDIGLYDEASHGGVYVARRRRVHGRAPRQAGLGRRIASELCFDAIERHHELRSQWGRGAEVELIRRADLVDLTSGLVRFELSREWLRDLFRSVSRDGTYPTIGRKVARQLIHRPLQFARIFRR